MTRYPTFEDLEASAAYFKLVEVSPSRRVADILKADEGAPRPYRELHHYKIFLDETGCHEVAAEAASML